MKTNIKTKLPSKKFALGVLLLVSAAAGLFLLDSYLKKHQEAEVLKEAEDLSQLTPAEELQLQLDALASLEVQDSDGDDLPDWEEALWGTDPNNSDSDGDGTLDGKQIRARQAELRGGDPLYGEPGNEEFNLFVQDTFLALQVLQQQGQYDEAAKEALADIIIQEFIRIDSYRVYRITDIQVVEPTIKTEDAFKNSIETLGAGLVVTTDLHLFLSELQTNKQGIIIAEVKETLEKLYDHRDALAGVAVPVTRVDEFLGFLNSYSSYVQIMDHLASSPVDPRQGLAASVHLESVVQVFIDIQKDLYDSIGLL